jgi:hypothetical protein
LRQHTPRRQLWGYAFGSDDVKYLHAPHQNPFAPMQNNHGKMQKMLAAILGIRSRRK